MKVVGVVVGVLCSLAIIVQYLSWSSFRNAGARFTAADGQELCLRIRRLEEVSYGFNDKQLHPLKCNYTTKDVLK